VAYLLLNDAVLRAHDEDADGAMESCRGILATARSIGDEFCLIAALIRLAVQSLAINGLERVLAQTEPSAPQLEAMQHLLAKEIDAPILWSAIRGERGLINGMVDGLEKGTIKLSALTGPGGGSIETWLIDQLPVIAMHGRADALRLMNQSVAAAKLPAEKQQQAFDETEDAMRSSTGIAKQILPASRKVSEAYLRQQANLRCAHAAIAAERYRIKHRRWPGSLDALCEEGLLPAVPLDPFDGLPLRFKSLRDGIAIYSIGFDRVDNDGNINRSRPRDNGVDLGVRLWSPDARRQPPLPPRPREEQ
jgi:hypothetical protein